MRRSVDYTAEEAQAYILDHVEFDPFGGCWISTLRWTKAGYSRIEILGWVGDLHRISFRAFKGEIPDGLCVCHRCDVRPCCNPDHLFAGTHGDNVADMMGKGRGVVRIGELNPAAALDAERVAMIRQLILGGARGIDLAARFNVTAATITDIKYRRSWAHL